MKINFIIELNLMKQEYLRLLYEYPTFIKQQILYKSFLKICIQFFLVSSPVGLKTNILF